VKYAAFSLLMGALLVVSGCATPCDEAADVLIRQCLREVTGETDMACEGERLAFNQCIIDHPMAACDWYYDPVAYAGNAFDLCPRAIPLD
jgi:hypothetical protein